MIRAVSVSNKHFADQAIRKKRKEAGGNASRMFREGNSSTRSKLPYCPHICTLYQSEMFCLLHIMFMNIILS